jgi:hypothetical protein
MGGTACKVPFATDYIQNLTDKEELAKNEKWLVVKNYFSLLFI